MASTIKVDNVQNQPGTNIINKCSTTITIGASSDTVALASGASQTGFGASGAVSWNTTKITADPANAVSGTGYFCDTSGSGFTVTLPTGPSAGDIVGLADYNGNFGTNNLTVGRNGSNINGDASDFGLAQNNTSAQFIYVDATEGWRIVLTGSLTGEGIQENFITATGGTPCSGAISGDYKIHTFTGPGTFSVSCVSNKAANNEVSYLVIAGGGGGGMVGSGGGGAGGFRESKSPVDSYSASSIEGSCAVTVTASAYPIVVGGGGAGAAGAIPTPQPASIGVKGNDSVFSTITSTGGGYGWNCGPSPISGGGPGGSGGGGNPGSVPINPPGAGAGNTPPTTPAQGFAGGVGTPGGKAGGGGAALEVGDADGAGLGGDGATTSISATPTAYAGGGGGGAVNNQTSLAGGDGGGGAGGTSVTGSPGAGTTPGTDGTDNLGGGGGGSGYGCSRGGGAPQGLGGSGGSGVVIIRYKFQ